MVDLICVTHSNYRVDDWQNAGFSVKRDFGLDLSAEKEGVPIWAPGAWAAATKHVMWMSAGQHWLTSSVADRKVINTTARMAHFDVPLFFSKGQVFAKLPETKSDVFIASVRQTSALLKELEKLPHDEPLQLQQPVKFLPDQVRCWVLDNKVVEATGYSTARPREEFDQISEHLVHNAQGWLQDKLPSITVPSAVVIDVGVEIGPHSQTNFRIIEANAAWSSDWYGANLRNVYPVIVQSQTDVPNRWEWKPSPLLIRSAVGLSTRKG